MDTRSIFNGERNQLNLKAGEAVFHQGEAGVAAYVLLDGEVALSSSGTHIETIEPGGIFGEMALIEKVTRSADAIAVSDCRLAVLDQQRFIFLIQQMPKFAIHMMKLQSDRLRKTTERAIAHNAE